jgi:electron transfer flavoprotein alpha subunit
MSKLFAVFAEVRDGKLRKVTLEALQAALTAKNEADRLVAVLMGEQVSSLRDELARYHIGQVHVMDHPDLKQYNPEIYFAALSEWMDRWKPDAVFLGHTAIGRDLAPMISAHMNAGQISDIISVEKAGSYFCFTRPLYAGKAFEKKQCLECRWLQAASCARYP